MKIFTTDQDMQTLDNAWKEKNFRLCTSWKQLFLYQKLCMGVYDTSTVKEIGSLAKRKLEKNADKGSKIAEEIGLV